MTYVALLIIFRTPWRWCSNACGKTVGKCWVQLQGFRNTYGPFTLGKRAVSSEVWRIWYRKGMDPPWLGTWTALSLAFLSQIPGFLRKCRVMHQGEWEVIPIVRHFLSWTSVNFARRSYCTSLMAAQLSGIYLIRAICTSCLCWHQVSGSCINNFQPCFTSDEALVLVLSQINAPNPPKS